LGDRSGRSVIPEQVFYFTIMPEFTLKQKKFIDLIISGKNIALSGKAGTGKSFITKEAIELLKQQGRKIIALAPTGVAANNINGQTIHSFFSLPPFGVLDYEACNFLKAEKRKLINAIDTIFIDEVSMMRPDILDGINWTLLKNGCKSLSQLQIVFIGDLKQLPPVINDNTMSVLYQKYNGVEFYNALCYNSLKCVDIELDEVKRQDDEEFLHHLNIVRDGGKSEYFRQFLSKDYHGIVLAPHNSTVQKYNEAGLKSINAQEHLFEAIVDGNLKAEDFNMESTIRVKHGSKIMYLSNSKDNPLVNGTIGIFHYKPNSKGDNCYFIEVNEVLYPLETITNTKKEYVLSFGCKAKRWQKSSS